MRSKSELTKICVDFSKTFKSDYVFREFHEYSINKFKSFEHAYNDSLTIEFMPAKKDEDKINQLNFHIFNDSLHVRGPDDEKVQYFKNHFNQYFSEIFSPDFNRVETISELFISHGMKDTQLVKIDKRYDELSFLDHLVVSSNTGLIRIKNQFIHTVFFNNLFQRASPYSNALGYTHYKKSFIELELAFMIHSDGSVHPYFHLYLPYTEVKKVSCFVNMNGPLKMYLTKDLNKFLESPIDENTNFIESYDELSSTFKTIFYGKIKRMFKKHLNIESSELDLLSDEAIKDYIKMLQVVMF